MTSGINTDVNLIDEDITTGIVITDPSDQLIYIDWFAYGAELTIGGVLFYTDEAAMTSGTIEFTVDGVVCPDTSGVGDGAIGGVFNCNLTGSYFMA